MYIIDQLTDPHWQSLVERHSSASAFHSAGWLRALSETYRYVPMAVTLSAAECELTNALPVCRIHSRLTGRRLVSLPFSDHCQPLASNDDELNALLQFASQELKTSADNFIELRPASATESPFFRDEYVSACYALHRLDLTPPLETIFNSLHKDSIQRKIRRADRESLTYEQGGSDDIL